ncbi:MAG: hypothetical protein NZM03_06725 [Limisphaera sp.]|nr:hypothetical protein [Limisphaera sp.]
MPMVCGLVGGAVLGFILGAVCGTFPNLFYDARAACKEDLVVWNSFSEVDRLRAELRALAHEQIAEAQHRMARALLLRASGDPNQIQPADEQLAQAIEQLEEALVEFHGTGLEAEILRPLFFALKHAGRLDRWLELYLQAAGRRASDRLITDFLDDALAIGRMTGRYSEVLRIAVFISPEPQIHSAAVPTRAPSCTAWVPSDSAPLPHENKL